MKTKTLYRPVGIKELELIADADWKAFPPRLGYNREWLVEKYRHLSFSKGRSCNDCYTCRTTF